MKLMQSRVSQRRRQQWLNIPAHGIKEHDKSKDVYGVSREALRIALANEWS